MSRRRGEVLTDKFVGLLADGNLFCFCAGIFRGVDSVHVQGLAPGVGLGTLGLIFLVHCVLCCAEDSDFACWYVLVQVSYKGAFYKTSV